MKYTAREVRKWDAQTERNGRWIPARSENYRFDSIRNRIKWAWGVLVGRYDALDWQEPTND